MSGIHGLTKEVFIKALKDAGVVDIADGDKLLIVTSDGWHDITENVDKAYQKLIESCEGATDETPKAPKPKLCAIKRTYRNGSTDYCIFKLPDGVTDYIPMTAACYEDVVVSIEEALDAQPDKFGWLSMIPEQTRC